MFGAHYFADIDFDRSLSKTQLFKQDELIELSGQILPLTDQSALVYDIKRFDLRTGQMSDYGFAIQPLIHTLKKTDYLIGGRYQMPVYRGKLPQEMLQAQNMQNTIENNKPRYIFKKLVELGRIEQLGKMQIVSQVIDLNPPDDSPLFADEPIPSMLHFFDKVNLASYSLEKIFRRFDDENDAYFE